MILTRDQRDQRREMERENSKQSLVCAELPRDQWLPRWPFGSAAPARVWRSRDFLVQLHEKVDGVRLSINRTTIGVDGRWSADISWDELQRVKCECGFGDRWAVEIFPPDAAVVNVANMRHLWLLPAAPPFGWNRGGV